MSGKTLFDEGLQTGEITPTFDQLKQQISELQKECEKLSIQLAAYEHETTKEKKVPPPPVIFESLRLSEQVVEIEGTAHRDNPFTP